MLDFRLRSRRWGLCAVLVVAGLALWAGCDSGGYSGPSGTVSGTLTLNGKPVPQGCTVVFVSDKGFTATGQVGAGGNYQLSVVGKGGTTTSGVPAATYQVSVSPPASGEGSEADYDAMMEKSASGEGQPEASQAEAEVIPAKYQSSGTSGLSFDVKEGPNTIDIPLD
jgi:type 1 fimbria pilin